MAAHSFTLARTLVGGLGAAASAAVTAGKLAIGMPAVSLARVRDAMHTADRLVCERCNVRAPGLCVCNPRIDIAGLGRRLLDACLAARTLERLAFGALKRAPEAARVALLRARRARERRQFEPPGRGSAPGLVHLPGGPYEPGGRMQPGYEPIS